MELRRFVIFKRVFVPPGKNERPQSSLFRIGKKERVGFSLDKGFVQYLRSHDVDISATCAKFLEFIAGEVAAAKIEVSSLYQKTGDKRLLDRRAFKKRFPLFLDKCVTPLASEPPPRTLATVKSIEDLL